MRWAIAFLRQLWGFLFRSGVRFGDGTVVAHGTQVGVSSGRVYSVFAPPLYRLDRWLWWLWEMRYRRTGRSGTVTMVVGGAVATLAIAQTGVAPELLAPPPERTPDPDRLNWN